jgi:hypothetical protein
MLAAAARLTPDELETYRRDGLVIPSSRLPDAQLASLRAALDRLIAANPGVRPEQLISAHVRPGEGAEKVRGDQAFLDLARDSALLDMVEQAIGPDIILWGCQVFCKHSKLSG